MVTPLVFLSVASALSIPSKLLNLLVTPAGAARTRKANHLICPAAAYCTTERLAEFSALSSTFEVLP
jgi:hypothetical protein